MTVLEVLTRARAILIEHGWCKKHLEMDGKYCASGSLMMAIAGSTNIPFHSLPLDEWHGAMLALHDTLHGMDYYKSVPDFNDQSELEDVLGLFDTTIRRLEDEAAAHSTST